MPIIDKIQLSGTVYTIGSENSGVTSGEVQTMIDNSLSGYVTTDTLQDITAQKTFVGDPNNSKKSIKFKQYNDTSKVGFVVVNSAETNNEIASFEFRPNTFKIGGVQHPLLYFGHYRNTNVANAGVPQTVIGYRQYDQKNNAAYHYLIPLPEKAKIPFSLTTSFKNYYAPIGFKNGSTMITADDTGVVNLTDAFNGKLDTSFFNTYRGLVDTALSGKQNTLSAGTGIDITDNVISATGGGGGGKAIEAGRGISITTGETADTVSFNLPISAGTGTNSLVVGGSTTASGLNSFAGGDEAIASGNWSFAFGRGQATNNYAFAANGVSKATKGFSAAFNTSEANNTYAFSCGTSKSNGYASFSSGWDNKSLSDYESSFGYYNVSNKANTTFGDSGNTLFSVGNGTADNARHNAFEIRQNGDIYCSDGTNDVKLQDTITATASNTTALGGLSLVKLSQSEYDALTTKDSNTLYIING